MGLLDDKEAIRIALLAILIIPILATIGIFADFMLCSPYGRPSEQDVPARQETSASRAP